MSQAFAMIAPRELIGESVELRRNSRPRSRPRVLHLINYFESGGTERQAVELLKRLDRKKFTIYLAALRNRGPLYQEIASLFPSVPEFPLTSFYDANFIRQVLKLRVLLLREHIDIVHAHDFYAGMLVTFSAAFTPVKVIACQRNLRLSGRLVHQWGQRAINRRADLVLVNSEAIRDQIISLGDAPKQKIKVIRNGIVSPGPYQDTSEQCSSGTLATWDLVEQDRQRRHNELCEHLKIDHDALLVGMVANLRPVKGHKYLIEAASVVLKRHPNVHFILVGEGELRSEIEDQVARLRIGRNIHLLGYRPDANSIATGFDLAVLTSLHEGLPNAIIEAMSVGCPVVASSVGGIPELIDNGHTGILVGPGDVGALAENVVCLLKDESLRAAIGRRAQDFVMHQLSMDQMVEGVEHTYEGLISGL